VTAAQLADLAHNLAPTNSVIGSPDTIGFGANGKIGKINFKAVFSADRCLCPDVGGVHGNPRSEVTAALDCTRQIDPNVQVAPETIRSLFMVRGHTFCSALRRD